MRVAPFAPFAIGVGLWSGLGCSLLIGADEFVTSASTSENVGAGGVDSVEPGKQRADFVVLAGHRDDLRGIGVFATDVTYGAFSADGTIQLWPAWTLPAPGRYVAARAADTLRVFGDPEDTDQEMVLWSSALVDSVLTPWRRVAAAPAPAWAAVAMGESEVLAVARDAEAAPGSAIWRINVETPTEASPVSATLLTPRLAASALVCAGNLFVVGGQIRPESDPPVVAAVESSTLTTDGLTPFRASAELQADGKTSPRSHAALACAGQRLYVIGGDAMAYGGAGSVEVWSGLIGADGTIPTWDREPDLLYPVSRAAAVVASGRLVVAGGFNATRIGTLAYAQLSETGHVVSWHVEGNDELPVPVQDPTAVALE